LLAALLLLPAGAGANIIVTGVNGQLGAAGFDGQPGGDGTPGHDATASGDDTDVQAFGGEGGPGGNGGPGVDPGENGGNGGNGGAGGDASAEALPVNPLGITPPLSQATGGKGGDGGLGASAGPGGVDGAGGNGGRGGDANAGGSVTALTPGAEFSVRAQGGDGGAAFDGGIAGDGGVASLGAITGDGPVALVGRAIGGNGGGGFGTGQAGLGASTELEDAITGTGFRYQLAQGGDGGDAEAGTPGSAGSASSLLTSSSGTRLATEANGGDGGDRNTGPDPAADGGTAVARSQLTSTEAEGVSSTATGGDGGSGAGGAAGGAGADAIASSSVTSDDCCGLLATASAIGGQGGAAEGAASPGRGGHADAAADAEGALDPTNVFPNDTVQASASAFGGDAGDGGTPSGADGGGASAESFARNHTGDASAGAGATAGRTRHGVGGDATATAGAAAATDSLAFAQATAIGGLGNGPGGRATALARVVSSDLGRATASATSSAPGTGLATEVALTMQVGLLIEGDGDVEARTVSQLSLPEHDLADLLRGAAFGAVLPEQADVDAALAASPEVGAALAGLQATALGFVKLSGAGFDVPFPPLPNAPNAEVSLDILLSDSVSLSQGALVLGLLGSSVSGEFEELRFRVQKQVGSDPIAQIVDEVFSDEAAWLAYFDDHAIDLGPLEAAVGESLRLTVFLETLGDDNSAAVSADFIVGVAVPEPSSGLLLACGVALLAASARKRGARP
jgi:hypothetical protein